MYRRVHATEDEILPGRGTPLPAAAALSHSLALTHCKITRICSCGIGMIYDEDEDRMRMRRGGATQHWPTTVPTVHHTISPPPNSLLILIPESCLPLQKRVRFASPTPSHEVRGSSSAVRASRLTMTFTDTRDELEGVPSLYWQPPPYRGQSEAMINKGVTDALAARDATRNGDDSHTSGTGVRRPVQVARECTYSNFLKCQPLNFKGTKGVSTGSRGAKLLVPNSKSGATSAKWSLDT
ncbi:hypothetical protein Tco_0634107 [Tanacetum coccineum]